MANKKLKDFILMSNILLELNEESKDLVLEELLINLITIVEKYNGYCTGGFELKSELGGKYIMLSREEYKKRFDYEDFLGDVDDE